jgi:hypothetical protein
MSPASSLQPNILDPAVSTWATKLVNLGYGSSQMQAIARPSSPINGWGGFGLDISEDTSVSMTATITDHVLGDGTSVHDHIVRGPIHIHCTGKQAELVFFQQPITKPLIKISPAIPGTGLALSPQGASTNYASIARKIVALAGASGIVPPRLITGFTNTSNLLTLVGGAVGGTVTTTQLFLAAGNAVGAGAVSALGVKLAMAAGYLPAIKLPGSPTASSSPLVQGNSSDSSSPTQAQPAPVPSLYQDFLNTGYDDRVVATDGSGVTSGVTRQNSSFQYMFNLFCAGMVFSVETPWGMFCNMVIEKCDPKQGRDSNGYTDYDVVFKQITFASGISTTELGVQFGGALAPIPNAIPISPTDWQNGTWVNGNPVNQTPVSSDISTLVAPALAVNSPFLPPTQ